MFKAIEVGSWEMIKWLMYLQVPITTSYLGLCLYLDRYHMINANVKHIVSTLDEDWINWIWSNCSPLALQWCLRNLPKARHMLSNPYMFSATPMKLELLKDNGIWLPEIKAEEAARLCNLYTFKCVLDVCRSWNPTICSIQCEYNFQNGPQIFNYISKTVNKQCKKSGEHLCCNASHDYRIPHPKLRPRQTSRGV